jgi:hypothetical protein
MSVAVFVFLKGDVLLFILNLGNEFVVFKILTNIKKIAVKVRRQRMGDERR